MLCFIWGNSFIKACYPPGNKTSWRRRNDVSLYVPATLQVRLKWNTQRRPDGTLPRRLIGTSSQRLKQVSNKTPNNISLVHHQDASMVRIHVAPLVRPYDVPCKSQMKHPLTSLWYVFTTSASYVVARVTFSFG